MAETTLETMVIKLVGDVTGYQRSLQQAQQQTQSASNTIASNLRSTTNALGDVDIKGREARKAFMLLSQTGIIPAEVTSTVWGLSEGLRSVKNVTGSVVSSFGLLGGALAATGIGAAVVGVTSLAVWLKNLWDESNKAKEAAKNAFQSFVTGARTAQQALSDVRINVLTEGMQELADIANPGLWNSARIGFSAATSSLQGFSDVVTNLPLAAVTQDMEAFNAIAARLGPTVEQAQADLLEARIQRIRERAEQAHRLTQRLQADPGIQSVTQQIARERNMQAAQDQLATLREEVDRIGMAENAARRYAAAQQLARQANISLAEAIRKLAPAHAEMQQLEQRRSLGRLDTGIIRQLQDEADRAGMTENASRRLAIAQEYARENSISLAEALRKLGPRLDAIRDAQNRIDFGNFNRGLQEQIQTFNLSADRVQLWRMEMEGATEAQMGVARANVEMLERMRVLQPLREQIATFGMSSERAQLYRLRLQGVAEATIQAALANVRQLESLRALQQPLERLTAVRAGSAEAFFQQQEFASRQQLAERQNELRNLPPVTGTPAATPRAGSAEGRYDAQMLAVMQQVRDFIRDMLRRQQQQSGTAVTLQPAGIAP